MHISIESLDKRYGHDGWALRGVTMDIENGMFGLLGPNGAGKTTLMRIIVTRLESTAGRVTIDGLDIRDRRSEVRRLLGYLPQAFSTFPRLTTWEFLDYSARLAGLKSGKARGEAVDSMLESVGLFEVRDRLANKLSGGMKRRLGIAQALIGSPKILVVDEPTMGLDPEERLRFRNLMSQMSSTDMIIILSTHIVGDISSSCTDMALLDRGRLVFRGGPEELIAETRGHVWRIKAPAVELAVIKERYPVVTTIPSREDWDIEIVGDRPEGYSATPIEPNLEHAYVYRFEGNHGSENHRVESGILSTGT